MYIGVGQSEDFCPVTGDLCFQSLNERDSAQSLCQYGHTPVREPGPCTQSGIIGPGDLYKYRPCDIAHLSACTANSPSILALQAQQSDGGGEPGESEDDNTMLYILGGVGVLLVGGIAFYMARKKK